MLLHTSLIPRLHHMQDDVDHEAKAAHIVKVVLERLDDDKNGVITSAEFEAHGLDGLPNFDLLGAEGHHYDVESGQLNSLTMYT